MSKEGKKLSKSKVVSYIIDGVLGVFLAFMIYCAGSIFISTHKSPYGIPSVFGTSLLYVATNSMGSDQTVAAIAPEEWNRREAACQEYEEAKAEGREPEINQETYEEYRYSILIKAEEERVGREYEIGHIEEGEAVAITKVDFSTLKVGDVITFYYEQIAYPDTHRIMEVSSDALGPYVRTRGDNLHASLYDGGAGVNPGYRDAQLIRDSTFIGKVTHHSAFLGWTLTMVSPNVPNSQSGWFLPLVVIVPLGVIMAMSIKDVIITYKKDKKERAEALALAMEEAHIDPKDEASAMLFEQKWELKRQMREELEAKKEEERLAREKQLQKAAKNVGKLKKKIANDPAMKAAFEKAGVDESDPMALAEWVTRYEAKQALRKEMEREKQENGDPMDEINADPKMKAAFEKAKIDPRDFSAVKQWKQRYLLKQQLRAEMAKEQAEKEAKEGKKEEGNPMDEINADPKMKASFEKANIDPSDEAAVKQWKERYLLKQQLRAEMAKEKEGKKD